MADKKGTIDLKHPCGKGKTPKKKERNDRFIPNRGASALDNAELLEVLDTSGSEYSETIAKQLSVGSKSRILSFKSVAKPLPPEGHKPDENGLYAKGTGSRGLSKPQRFISPHPERVLDAPDMMDDFYLNVLHWGPKNQLAVALGPCLYIWNGDTGDVHLFLELEDPNYYSSVRWTESGTHLAIGLSDSTIHMYDVAAERQLRLLRGHTDRVNALSWNQQTLTSGGRGLGIMNSDVRVREHCTAVLQRHEQEICGVAWSPARNQLASGANDNLLLIWDSRNAQSPLHELTEHRAAVKGLAWCPFQSNVLASGGGTADHHIRIWNTCTGSSLAAIDANSQVSSLLWNPHDKELLAGLGFSHNQLCLYKYPSFQKMAELYAHTSRILHLALSPDGCTVCSGAADETLRFWKMFEPAPTCKSVGLAGVARSTSKGTNVLKSVNIR